MGHAETGRRVKPAAGLDLMILCRRECQARARCSRDFGTSVDDRSKSGQGANKCDAVQYSMR